MLFICLGLFACAYQADSASELQFENIIWIDSVPVYVVVFDTPQTRAKGLMNVAELPDNAGALFVFDRATTVSFWMKNTLTPLDLLFFDRERRLLHIEPAVQPCKAVNCEHITVHNTQFVVEVPSGFSELQSLSVGRTVLTMVGLSK